MYWYLLIGYLVSFSDAVENCKWTSCQKNDSAVQGCQKNEFEDGQRACKTGLQYNCCKNRPRHNELDEADRECWWLFCVSGNATTFNCPTGLSYSGSEPCGDNLNSIQCCGKTPKVVKEDKTLLTGQSYEDFVKSLFLQHDDHNLQPDHLRCDMVDPGKKHFLRIQNNGIRICDLCPRLPQNHLANVYLDRVPKKTQNNLYFDECFGLCYDEKTCMAVSYDQTTSTCFLFDSTAGSYQSDQGWVTVLMTQPSGIVRDWSYSRHTRLLGRLMDTSQQASFLHCLDDCDKREGCNYASYMTKTNKCSLFADDKDLVYVDLVYGHLAGLRVSDNTSTLTPHERFVLDGEELSLKNISKTDEKCNHLRNSTHGAHFSEACLVSGSSIVGCGEKSGCKICYYPERSGGFEKLSICPDSEFERLNILKTSIVAKMKGCLNDTKCIGVGYESNTEEVSTINIQDFIERQFTTRYLLKIPPNDNRKYLQQLDLVVKADIKPITTSKRDFKELNVSDFQSCIDMFNKNQFTRMSYSLNSKICKFGTEKTAFIISGKNESVSVFKRPSLLSPALNYLRTPGFGIVSGKPRATTEKCVKNCEDICLAECSKQYGEWCMYVSFQQKRNHTRCHFYDQDPELKFEVNENSVIMTKMSSLNFTLQSFDMLDAFQASDISNCFEQRNTQTQTSLTIYQQQKTTARHFRGMNFGKWIQKVGKGIGKGIQSNVEYAVDTAEGVAGAVENLVQGKFEAAGQSAMTIPIVDFAKTTVELGEEAVAGNWNGVEEKGHKLLHSSTLEMVTNIAMPGSGKILATTAQLAINAATSVGKGRVASSVKTRRMLDYVAKTSRKVKNEQHSESEDNSEKTDELIKKERGEKCNKQTQTKKDPHDRQVPGNCNRNNNLAKCPKPKKVVSIIGKTLDDCDNLYPGQKCTYECKPGYKEEKTTAVCAKKGNNISWQPTPHCVLKDCPKGNNPLIIIDTPQAEVFGNAALGAYLTAYVALFDKQRKLPIWSVALHQSGQFESKKFHTTHAIIQPKGFKQYPCKELRNSQANNKDYKGHGQDWQKGHLTPPYMTHWSEKAKLGTNLYINAAPQDAYTNTGPWNLLEAHLYCFSKRVRTVVATGICPESLPQKVGSIPIPTCYWKMACYRDEEGNHQVVGFYGGNTPTRTPKEEEQRNKEIFEPLSQDELLRKISGGFNEVWEKPARHLTNDRPDPVGTGLWFPVNVLSCRDQGNLSSYERNAWRDALQSTVNELDADKKLKGDSKKASRRFSNKSRRNQKTTFGRGCLEPEIKNALSETGFYVPYSEQDDSSDSELSVQDCGKRIVGYYTSWGEKTITELELQRLTHVIYAFLEMDADGKISIGSVHRNTAKDADRETKNSRKRLENLMESAKRYPHLNVMFAVGGWENSQYFSDVAASPAKRVTFIAAVIRMIEEWGFDGVDVNWQYPVTGGAVEGIPADKENYVILMKELRMALDVLAAKVERTDKFLISFAGAAAPWTLDPGYDLPGLFQYSDFVNVMTYDYFGALTGKGGAFTGPPSPLYFGMPRGFSGKTNADWTVKYYSCKTQQPHKINMGVPFYGRYWENAGALFSAKDEMWRKASRVNETFVGGYAPWYKLKVDYVENRAYEKKFHDRVKTPFAWNPAKKIFVGYENVESLEHKVNYAVDKNIGGLMIWALDYDDDDLTLLNTVVKAPLCQKTDPNDVNFKCSPIDEKRWWTLDDGLDKAGLCGRSAPLYKGFYPVCDPEDPGYSCCGADGGCGIGPKFCDCPTCVNYGEDPKRILEEPVKPEDNIIEKFRKEPKTVCIVKNPFLRNVDPPEEPAENVQCTNLFCQIWTLFSSITNSIIKFRDYVQSLF